MCIYLGLGSNLGDRKENLRIALSQLQTCGVAIQRVSPVIESPALLPRGAAWEWNKPFLNLAIGCETSLAPEQLLAEIKRIEFQLGRNSTQRWSPRPIDIDILLWRDDIIQTELLTVPHVGLHQRHFALTPLIALNPQLTIPGRGEKTLLQWSQTLPHHIPHWMGILNITPDSFSDGGIHDNLADAIGMVETMVDWGATILDIGGESTRPGAETITPDEEWRRISPIIECVQQKYKDDPLRPQVSVDTRNPSVASLAIKQGVDYINDVGGLANVDMLALATDNNCQWIAMHSLSVPADSRVVMEADADPVAEVCQWIEQNMEKWIKAGVNPSNIIIDPGIGFGKDPLQSLQLLQNVSPMRQYGLRLLIGHSRKSFMKQFAGPDIHERDMITIGSSLHLCQQGIDIIRVHNVPDHIAAYKGWAHLAG